MSGNLTVMRKRPDNLTVHDTPCFRILLKTPFHKLAIKKHVEESLDLSAIYVFKLHFFSLPIKNNNFERLPMASNKVND